MKYYISLGSNCGGANYLRSAKKRSMAFPFDWSVTPMQSVISLFKNNFNDFLEYDNLIFNPPAERKLVTGELDNPTVSWDMTTPVFDKKYGIFFPHDFSVNGKEDYNAVKEKYDKRIQRMFDLFADKKNRFCFIAQNASIHKYQIQQYTISGIEWNNKFDFWQDRLSRALEKYDIKFETMTLLELQQGYA